MSVEEFQKRQAQPIGSIAPGPLVISIQSQVIHGHVGNSAAVLPMQMLGVTVAAVPTTLLSNHPLYPTMRGRVLGADLVADLLLGVEERGLVEAATVLVTGYLGSAEIGAVVAEFVDRARVRNPDLLYVCDPVIGDDDVGVFIPAALADLIQSQLVPKAAIVTPNQFELELLTGVAARTPAALQEAVALLRASGVKQAIVTGCTLEDTPAGQMETIVCDGAVSHRIATPRLPIGPAGTGDLFTGLLVAHLAKGADLIRASDKAVAGVFAVLQRTWADNSYEMRLLSSE
jgi:pyridoxine kinase